MKPIRIGVAGTVVLAVGLLVAAFAYAAAQGSTEPALGESSSPRSPRAKEVEAAVASTNLVHRLEVALDSGFGGVWFEPSGARLDVGVTSSASRRDAEAVAAQAGLTDAVREIPVRWTWAQLQAAQERWNRRLDDLFEQGKVTTSLSPPRNSVQVELGSAVSSSRRTALRRAAAADRVAVSIVRGPYARARLMPQARCATFKARAAVCEPQLVSGVTIRSPKEAEAAEEFEEGSGEEPELEEKPEYEEEGGKQRFQCTAGPLAIPKDRAKPENATKTYVLTAGHCINEKKGGGGVGGKWDAYDKKDGFPKGEHELGTAAAYINSGTDIGAILITPGFWAKDKDPVPVSPTIAAWNSLAESDPFPVIKQITPVLNATTCMAGQTTGVNCGKIVQTGLTLPSKRAGVKINNLFEVEKVLSLKGDSGSPWFAESQYKANPPEGYMEGVEAGENTATGRAVFHSLLTAFAELEKVSGLGLELLTQANQRRHPKVDAEQYPVTIHGSSSAGQKITTEAGSIECKSSTYHAVVSEAGTSTLTLKPEYKECKASFLEASATISMEECAFVLHVVEKTSTDNYHAYVDVSCPTGQSIKIAASTCKAEIKAQSGRETVDLIDDTSASPKKDITLRPTLTSIAYTVTQDGLLCPFSGTGEKTNGEYTSSENITVTGQSPSEPSKKIGIEVAD